VVSTEVGQAPLFPLENYFLGVLFPVFGGAHAGEFFECLVEYGFGIEPDI
jgi:hypothetical protein